MAKRRKTRSSNRRRANTIPANASIEINDDGDIVVRSGKSSKPRPRLVRILHTYGWRHRRIMIPVYLILALSLADLGVHRDMRAAVVLGLLGSGLVTLAAWTMYLKTWVARAYLSACLFIACLTMILSALRGTAGSEFGVNTIAMLAAALPWWWRHRYIHADAVTAPDMPAIDEWTEYVACTAGPLPKSRLINYKTLRNGWEADGLLDRGKTSSKAISMTEEIASALDIVMENLIIERDKTGSARRFHVTYFEQNPLHDVIRWTGAGLNADTGTIPLGPYATGGEAEFVAWVGEGSGNAPGARHSLICGAPGSGKSMLLNLLILEYLLSERCVVWMIDLQNGQSLPEFVEHVDWAALGLEEAMTMLRAAHVVLHERSRYLGRKLKVPYIVPSRDFPMLRLVIDEAHALLNDPTYGKEAVKILEDITKMGRKCAIGVDLVTQIPSLDQLGNSETLRSMVSSGNVICFRTAGKMSDQLAFQGVIAVDPNKIPQQFENGQGSAGLMYLAGLKARTSAARSFLIEDVAGKAAEAARRGAVLDKVSAKVAGAAYANRHGGDGATADAFTLAPTTGQVHQAGTVVPAVAVAAAPGRQDPDTERDDAAQSADWRNKGIGCVDVVFGTLEQAGRPLTRGEVILAADKLAVTWGRSAGYAMRSVSYALSQLKQGMVDGRRVTQDDGERYSIAVGATVQPADSDPEPAEPAERDIIAELAQLADGAELDERQQLRAEVAEVAVCTNFGSALTIKRRTGIAVDLAEEVLAELEVRGIVGERNEDNGTRIVLVHSERLAEAKAAAAASDEMVASVRAVVVAA